MSAIPPPARFERGGIRTRNIPVSSLKYLFFHHALFIVFGAGGGIWTLTPCGSGFWVHGVCHSTTPALVASLGNAPSSPNLWDSDVHLYPSNFGGVGRIRTYSVIDGRFTVCCGSPTPRLPHLIYLLYNTYFWKSSIIFSKFGAPSRTRTYDLRIRSPLLCPAELWAQQIYSPLIIHRAYSDASSCESIFWIRGIHTLFSTHHAYTEVACE